MCIVLAAIPAIMAAVSAVTAAAGTGVAIAGAQQQAASQAATAQYESKMAVQQAQSTADASRVNAQQTYRQGDLLEGTARAAGAASGIDPNSGTSLLNQGDIGTRTGQNVADQGYNASLAQWGGLNQSSLLNDQAANDKAAGAISATGSLLSEASQVSNKWAGFTQAGVFSGAGTTAPGWN